MELETQCPQCGSKLFKDTGSLDTDAQYTCAGCGHTAKLVDFLTPDSANRLNQAIQDEVAKAFSGIPGLKF